MERILKRLTATNINNTKGLILYTLFQKKVMEDDFGAYENNLIIKNYEDSRDIMKKRLDHEMLDYQLDSNAAVFIVSGNKENMGTILNVNYEIKELLGYKKKRLIGENVALMIPAIIGVNHNHHMEGYFKKRSHSNVNGIISTIVLPQHVKGYIVPCSILVRLIPNLENGAQFFAFLSLAKDISKLRNSDVSIEQKEVFVFLLNEKYEITGFCENFMNYCCEGKTDNLNIKRCLENKEKIAMRTLYNHLFAGENEEAMENEEGLTIKIDFKPLKIAIHSQIVDTYDASPNSRFTLHLMIVLIHSHIKKTKQAQY